MINLTVKTLDSRNHQFSVEGDMTVEDFKRHIAETVNIPAETQRIIYCGRVLQDTSKLNDHDLNGKVVHLVQRPPPSATSQRSSRSSSPHPQRRAFRPLDHANTMFLGSVAFPTNFMDSPPLSNPIHTNSRLHVIRKMLRRAERILNLLENPNRSGEQTPVDDPQEEVTPVIEARVIVPSGSEPLDEATLFSAVHNYSVSSNRGRNSTNQSSISSASNSGEQNRSSDAGPEDGIRTSRMAEMLAMLTQVHQRFTPFLERYHNFLRDDPVTAEDLEEQRRIQLEQNRVSEVMHFLSHAYHALSDMFIRVMTPPPRPVLCRPILIQHSAVLQAGIPIQVEAQINLSNERPSAAATSTQTPPSGATHASSNATTAPTATPQPFPSQAVPLISTVRVPIPLEIRGVGAAAQTAPFVVRNLMNVPTVGGGGVVTSSQSDQQQQQQSGGDGETATSRTASNNQEVEFIMEVTPEGITIDSLETAIIDSNQADDLLRGALNGQQPPNLIQSIMQMANQLITQRGGGATTSVPSGATVAVGQQQQSMGGGGATSAPTLTPTPPAQNSQARGNNQTHPTSSTQTRSTARPHVHLQHQTVHGGFDPFLPCNSHYVARRRHVPPPSAAAAAAQGGGGAGGQRADQQQQTVNPAQDAANQINNLMNSIMSGIRNTYQMRRTAAPAAARGVFRSENAAAAASSSTGTNQPPPALFALSEDLFRNGPSLADILQQFPMGAPYVPGESIITDFIMLLSRNLTMGDVLALNSGNVAPLARLSGEIQNFFRASLMNGRTDAIEVGVERLLQEIQPFIDNLADIPIRDDVDIDASVRQFLRAKLPLVLELSAGLAENETNLRRLVDHLIESVKEFCVLLHACTGGTLGLEQIFEIIITRYLQGIPNDLQDWTLATSRNHLRQFFANLNVPTNAIERFVILRTNSDDIREETCENSCEISMETEETASGGGEAEAEPSQSERLDDISEQLPNVVIGSEPWHNQVPADWVPLIARDAQRQKKQHSQGSTFSDAYLSGMPSKRRKIVHATKGRQGLPMQQVIADSVRRAVTATGLATVAPVEVVAQAAGSSTDIQAAYRGLLRTSVQPRLRNNLDFTPERFPHATDYFNES